MLGGLAPFFASNPPASLGKIMNLLQQRQMHFIMMLEKPEIIL